MANSVDREPLDNPEKGEYYRAFQEYLETHDRLVPKIREDIGAHAQPRDREKAPVAGNVIDIQPPVVRRGDAGNVTVNMAGLVIAYNEKDPAQATFVPGRATDEVTEAARMLFRASVRLRTLAPDDVQRRMAGVAKINASAKLLELQRPDITLSTRLLFDGDVPGLPAISPKRD